MKKIFLFLLLIPLAISAKGIETNIECDDTFRINEKVSCNLTITNDYNSLIKSIEFNKNEALLNMRSSFEVENKDKVVVNLNSSEQYIKVLQFDYLVTKNNDQIILNKIVVNTDNNTYERNELSKTLTIKNIAFVDSILINNQPLIDFDKNQFNYVVNLYEFNDYVEVKVVTSGKNKSDVGTKLFKSANNPIKFSVSNEYDTEVYEIRFVYNEENENEEISLEEFPNIFNKNKRYYYLEINDLTSSVTINNNKYILKNGENQIKIKNTKDSYLFVINKIVNGQNVNNDKTIKSLRIGETFLNVRNDEFEYNYLANEIGVVTIETSHNQDYEIRYNNDNILITIYDAQLNKNVYKINIIGDDEESNVEVEEYDKTKTVFIFLIFLLLFILLVLILIRKRKKECID